MPRTPDTSEGCPDYSSYTSTIHGAYFKLTRGKRHSSSNKRRTHLGGFSMSSRHSVLSVNVICEYLIPSSLYCMRIVRQQWIMLNCILLSAIPFAVPGQRHSGWKTCVTSHWWSWYTAAQRSWSGKKWVIMLVYISDCSVRLSNSSTCVC